MVCLEEFFAQGDQEKVLGIPAGALGAAVNFCEKVEGEIYGNCFGV